MQYVNFSEARGEKRGGEKNKKNLYKFPVTYINNKYKFCLNTVFYSQIMG
jgi:hypothetical protein